MNSNLGRSASVKKMRSSALSNATSGRGRFSGFAFMLVLLVLSSHSSFAVDSSTYSYRLLKSEDERVCRRMTAVYNKNFSQPFAIPGRLETDGDVKVPVHSRYPTSPEFDAIKWEFKTYPWTQAGRDNGTWSGLLSEFDIDNDGVLDVVFKSLFFGGSSDQNEQLIVFSSTEFDPKAVKDWREFSEGQREGSKPRFIYRGAVLRPFLLNNKSYLSAYDYKRYTNIPGIGETRNAPHTPPEFMRIYQYEGGGHRWPGFESEVRLRELCVISMSRKN